MQVTRYTPSVLGALASLILSALLVGVGDGLLRRWTSRFDPALRIGLAGLVGLGVFGLLLLPVGLMSTSFPVIVGLGGLLAALGFWQWRNLLHSARFEVARQGLPFLATVVTGIVCIGTFIVSLGPSDAMDWDSLAYHLAVPKIWILEGKISYIGFIHHSNFPFAVDNLYLFGLHVGGESGAKAFTVAYFAFGLIAVFGFVRGRFGINAGWWSVLALLGVPALIWETGTAYIDAAHGMLAGLGILLIARWLEEMEDKDPLFIGAIMLGLGAASKYTGLQVVLACGFVIIILLLARNSKAHWRPVILAGGIAIAIPSPWLLKNAIWTGNPVFPFFYERFGGRNWDQFAADIYRDEQQTFGVGRTAKGRDPLQIGSAILGLAYQPGRYVNRNQEAGGGFPIGALGAVVVAAGLAVPLSGKARGQMGYTLGIVLVCLAMWFFLSQQSRYLTALAVPLCAIAGASISLIRAGPLLALMIAGQVAYTTWLIYVFSLESKLPVVFGRLTKAEYHSNLGPAIANIGSEIDGLAGDGEIALYDEVFGFYLNKPYVWANPGHSTMIQYDRCSSGRDLMSEFKKLDVRVVVFNISYATREANERWLGAAGLRDGGEAFTQIEIEAALGNRQTKWRVLLADAVRNGYLKPALSKQGLLAFTVEPIRE